MLHFYMACSNGHHCEVLLLACHGGQIFQAAMMTLINPTVLPMKATVHSTVLPILQARSVLSQPFEQSQNCPPCLMQSGKFTCA